MDSLLRVYREQLGSWGDYLTHRGLVHVPSLERLLRAMGDMEEEVFAARVVEAAKFEKKKRRFDRRAPAAETDEEEATGDEGDAEKRQAAADADMLAAVAERLALEKGGAGGAEQPPLPITTAPEDDGGGAFTETRVVDRRSEAPPVDPFSYKARYYWDKFGITYKRGVAADDAVLRQVVHSFVEALQWVMLYYFRGCPSWGWFYCSHYARESSLLVGGARFSPLVYNCLLAPPAAQR